MRLDRLRDGEDAAKMARKNHGEGRRGRLQDAETELSGQRWEMRDP